MFTIKQYLSKECTHQQFYEQFCKPGADAWLIANIGRDAIVRSTDRFFNDTPISLWRKVAERFMASAHFDVAKWKAARQYPDPSKLVYSPSDAVCIVKAIAERIRREADKPV